MRRILIVTAALAAAGCVCPVCDDGAARAPTFGEDVAFLQRHTDAFVLSDGAGEAQVAVVPLYQGRVMTSTAGGPGGTSFGWLNRELIARGERQPHINVFGGEDRFWLGPEGGQYSLFFKPGAPFDLAHWQTPAAIDWGGWKTAGRTETEAHFRKAVTQTNYTGTVLKLRVDRTVRLIARDRAARQLGVTLDPALDVVAFETDNRITHIGAEPWTPQGGLPSIWILGMFNPSDTTTIVIPFKPGPEAELGPVVNDAYFGKVPPDRLKVGDGVLYFRGDGRYRSKIGIGPERARPVLGSYDALRRVLTLVQYTLPDNAAAYVNSMWELQDEPYGGDVVNSYNDGPPAPGAPPLGPFYELETSSPAAALLPGQTLRHIHRTIHLQGPETALEPVARAALGVSPAEIRAAFGN